LKRYAHLVLGIGFTVFLLAPFLTASELPLAVLSGGIGSVFPDLDTRFRHRKALHNVFSLAATSIAALAASYFFKLDVIVAASYTLGYISHIFGDMLTKRGVAVLYPLRGRFYRFPLVLGRSEDLIVNILGVALGAAMIFLGVRWLR